MTTQRLYYDDSYTTQFTARILEHTFLNDKPAVILDQTYFYPTGGGQPFDTGIINAVSVVDVLTRDDDKAVIHILAQSLTGDTATAVVNWSRRFDFMQHHTGQHILTQAFVKTAGINTVGFHLSDESVTIDLDTGNLEESFIDVAEDLANQIIYENRPVHVRQREMDDQEGIRIRRLPRHLLTEGLRVIEIEDFDATACGGTHVAHTGEIGLIKILKAEKRGTKTRIEFRCGGRALRDYREKTHIANQLAADLNCRFPETIQLLANLREELKTAQSSLKAAIAQLIEHEAAQLLATAQTHGALTIITRAYADRDPTEIRILASKLASNPKTAVFLGAAGEKAQFFFARSEDLSLNIGQLLKECLTSLGGHGGGQPNFAQGGGIPININDMQLILEKAAETI